MDAKTIERLKLKQVAGGEVETEISGCYISDLLSLAMSRIQKGNIWITVQGNINIVGVAALTEASCIIIAENASLMQNTIDKANIEGIPIYTSEKTAFELAYLLHEILV